MMIEGFFIFVALMVLLKAAGLWVEADPPLLIDGKAPREHRRRDRVARRLMQQPASRAAAWVLFIAICALGAAVAP